MERDTEVKMTVKEWAEKSGLKLYNYDGFKGIYSKLSGNDAGNFYENSAIRFRDAGDLICTRKAFESRLMSCTMQLPEMSQYEEMADVIPEFVEKHINLVISARIGQLKHYSFEEDKLRETLETLLSLMKHKANAREKSLKINGTDKKVEFSEINETELSPAVREVTKDYNGTVEDLETKLSDEAIQSLEEMLQKQRLNLSEVPINKIEALSSILYETAREKVDYKKIDEEFMYLNVPGQKKEPFIKNYNIIGEDGIRPGVAFDLETADGRVKGAMPTTPEIDDKIKRTTGQKSMSIDEIPKTQEIDKSLQIIDSEVGAEDRISLKTRIKEFMRKIVDKIKGKNEGRE